MKEGHFLTLALNSKKKTYYHITFSGSFGTVILFPQKKSLAKQLFSYIKDVLTRHITKLIATASNYLLK
jgi:hypothetical protein